MCGDLGPGSLHVAEPLLVARSQPVGRDQLQVKGIDQDQLTNDDGSALKANSLPTVVIQCFDMEHHRVDIRSDLGETPLKVREERRIV